MGDVYDREGNPVPMTVWAGRLSSEEYKRVASDNVNGIHVSTVWVGLDHSDGNGPPLIFETMTFGEPYDSELTRYSTEAEAVAGHKSTVECLRAGKAPFEWLAKKNRSESGPRK